MSELWSRWKWARLHARHGLLGFWRAVMVIVTGPAPRPEPVNLPGPSHPSELCKCDCGGDGLPAEHDSSCEWLQQMCPTCDGSGWCPACFGNGSRAP